MDMAVSSLYLVRDPSKDRAVLLGGPGSPAAGPGSAPRRTGQSRRGTGQCSSEDQAVLPRDRAVLLGGPGSPAAGPTRQLSNGYPASAHASSPPASGRTTVNPLSMSRRATRAADASLGHVQ